MGGRGKRREKVEEREPTVVKDNNSRRNTANQEGNICILISHTWSMFLTGRIKQNEKKEEILQMWKRSKAERKRWKKKKKPKPKTRYFISFPPTPWSDLSALCESQDGAILLEQKPTNARCVWTSDVMQSNVIVQNDEGNGYRARDRENAREWRRLCVATWHPEGRRGWRDHIVAESREAPNWT